MKLFSISLKNAIWKKFTIRPDIFVSKKEKHIHIAFKKPFICYEFFNELLNFVEKEWEKRREFFLNYEIIYSHLITSLKRCYDYLFCERKKSNGKQST